MLQVQQGSLYPALHRLEQQGWIRAKWAESETGRQAKFYSLTAAGRAQLEREKESWSRLSTAINLVVEGGSKTTQEAARCAGSNDSAWRC